MNSSTLIVPARVSLRNSKSCATLWISSLSTVWRLTAFSNSLRGYSSGVRMNGANWKCNNVNIEPEIRYDRLNSDKIHLQNVRIEVVSASHAYAVHKSVIFGLVDDWLEHLPIERQRNWRWKNFLFIFRHLSFSLKNRWWCVWVLVLSDWNESYRRDRAVFRSAKWLGTILSRNIFHFQPIFFWWRENVLFCEVTCPEPVQPIREPIQSDSICKHCRSLTCYHQNPTLPFPQVHSERKETFHSEQYYNLKVKLQRKFAEIIGNRLKVIRSDKKN